MPLHTVAPQRLYRQIAEQLRQLMASGEFALGSRLPAERDLALQLGVSRPSVREALIALEVEGMIEVRTGSGIYVQHAMPTHGPRMAALSADLKQHSGQLGPAGGDERTHFGRGRSGRFGRCQRPKVDTQSHQERACNK
jgi:DNA-binding FadR family transcriptional regulator